MNVCAYIRACVRACASSSLCRESELSCGLKSKWGDVLPCVCAELLALSCMRISVLYSVVFCVCDFVPAREETLLLLVVPHACSICSVARMLKSDSSVPIFCELMYFWNDACFLSLFLNLDCSTSWRSQL